MTLLRRTILAAALAAALVPPAAALVHNHLLKSLPAKDETVAAPKAISLWFAEKPEPAVSGITLKAADSSTVKLGAVAELAGEKNAITAPIEGALKPGAYVVQYRTAGTDGHPLRGSYGFTVK